VPVPLEDVTQLTYAASSSRPQSASNASSRFDVSQPALLFLITVGCFPTIPLNNLSNGCMLADHAAWCKVVRPGNQTVPPASTTRIEPTTNVDCLIHVA
jgi:hypothetical protein